MRKNRFQINVTTGRLTLPVVILVCLMLWIVSLDSWSDLGTLFIATCTAYIMIEANTAFTLIRTRTTSFVSLFIYLFSIQFFLHAFQLNAFTPIAWIIALFQLFKNYESSHPSGYIFHTFLSLSIGSLFFPQLLFFVPIFFIGTFYLRALNIKSFFASLLGLLVPYWGLFCYAFYTNNIELFNAPIQELVHFEHINYSHFPKHVWISWILITTLQLVCSIHYLTISHQDKTRTRTYMSFLIIIGLYTLLILLMQPHHLNPLLSVQLICTSFLASHLFTLTQNRFSGIFFIVTFVSLITLGIYNLWMQYFNF